MINYWIFRWKICFIFGFCVHIQSQTNPPPPAHNCIHFSDPLLPKKRTYFINAPLPLLRCRSIYMMSWMWWSRKQRCSGDGFPQRRNENLSMIWLSSVAANPIFRQQPSSAVCISSLHSGHKRCSPTKTITICDVDYGFCLHILEKLRHTMYHYAVQQEHFKSHWMSLYTSHSNSTSSFHFVNNCSLLFLS